MILISELDREEVRRMFKLKDLRETRVWQEAQEEGRRRRDRELVERLRARGRTLKEIEEILGISGADVRRLLGRQDRLSRRRGRGPHDSTGQ